MKIGIITYHFARNYGAVLQCYALQTYLLRLGHCVEVLDYETETQSRNNSLHHKRSNPILNLAVNIALLPFEKSRQLKEKRFSSFEKHALGLSPRLNSIEELSAYVNANKFDLLISGSDQVFNPKIADFDRAFVFPFETDAIKASFAASFGNAALDDVIALQDELGCFDYLCVREESDAPIARQVSGRDPKIADDPVFLLDKMDWEEMAQEITKNDKGCGYVLGYFINKAMLPRYLELTKEVSRSLQVPMKVINVRFGPDSFKDFMIASAGPSEFLGLFTGASFVCTDSFHGTAFSLIFGKRFASFEPKEDSNDWRKRDLLSKTGESKRSLFLDGGDVESQLDNIIGMDPVISDTALADLRINQEMRLREMTALVEGR